METDLRRNRLTRALMRRVWIIPVFGLLLVGAMWVALVWQLDRERASLLERATADTAAAADKFEEDTLAVLKAADRLLLRMKYQYEQSGLNLRETLATGALLSEHVALAAVTDAYGNVVASDRDSNDSMAAMPYFDRQRRNEVVGLDVSEPMQAGTDEVPVVFLTRRLDTPEGGFAGVVALAVRPAFFSDNYQKLRLGTQGIVVIVGADGLFRARRVGARTLTQRDGKDNRLFQLSRQRPEGTFETYGKLDGVRRIMAWRTLAHYPLVVAAGQGVDEVLAGHAGRRRIGFELAALATALIAGFFAVLTLLVVQLRRSDGEIRSQRRFLQTLLDHVPEAIMVRSLRGPDRGRYVLWNTSSRRMFRKEPGAVIGRRVADVFDADAGEKMDRLDAALLASPAPQTVEQSWVGADGRPRHYGLVRAPIFGDDGAVEFVLTSARDVTLERAQTEELRLASKVYETTIDAIMVTDADDRVIMVNEAFTRLTGYAEADVVSKIYAESPFAPPDTAEWQSRMSTLRAVGQYSGEVLRPAADGRLLSLWISASCERDDEGRITHYVRVFSDIAPLKEAQRKLEQLASYDALTGLPNRRLFLDRLDHAARRARRTGNGMAVLFVDLDRFKDVNDDMGHDVGDLLLCEAADRMAACIRSSDTVARLGGDEFAVILEGVEDPADTSATAARIVATLAMPFFLAGRCASIGASVGIAIFPEDGMDAVGLLKAADIAMYAAKRGGRSRYVLHADAASAPVPEEAWDSRRHG